MGSFATRKATVSSWNRRRAVALVLAVALTAAIVGPTSSALHAADSYTRFVIDAESNHVVMSGHVEGTVLRQVQSDPSYLHLRGEGDGRFWNLVFAAPHGEALEVGVYEGTRRIPTSTRAGLNVSSAITCEHFGRLAIDEVGVDGSGKIDRLLARFQARCDGKGPAIFGSVAFNASGPPPSHRIEPRTVSFGSVPQGTPSSTETVALRNSGAAPMSVGTITTSAPFSIVGDTCSGATLAPWQLCTVKVRASTQHVGAFARRLLVPNSFTTIDGSGAFSVILKANVVVGAKRFVEQSISVPGSFVPLVGDWDGDELDHDILWYQPGPGTDSMWFADGDRTFTRRPVTVNGRYEPIVGYFDGDAVTDVLWYAPGPAPDWLWYGVPGGGWRAKALTIGGWFDPVVGDFDGNGVDDILWYGRGAAHDSLWLGRTSGRFLVVGTRVNGDYDAVFPLDVDGNGRTDLLWWRTGEWVHPLWTATSSGAFTGSPWGAPTRDNFPITGYFDDDVRSDVFWYGPGPVPDRVDYSGRSRFDRTVSGYHVPLAANFTGDNTGRDEIFWWNVFGSKDYIWSGDNVALVDLPFENTKFPVDPYWPVLGYFDSVASNNAVDILWYGPGATPDRMFWAIDVDGPPPAASSAATGPAIGRDAFRELVRTQARR